VFHRTIPWTFRGEISGRGNREFILFGYWERSFDAGRTRYPLQQEKPSEKSDNDELQSGFLTHTHTHTHRLPVMVLR
jgi:hypothetical protein